VVAALVLVPVAGSADGDPLLLGSENLATSSTVLETAGFQGLAVLDTHVGATALEGAATAPTGSGWGVAGATSSAGADAFGVWGGLNVTTPGAGSAGVFGRSASTTANGYGVWGKHEQTNGTAAGVFGDTNSTSASAVGVGGMVDSPSAAPFSAGVRGVNNANVLGVGVEGVASGVGYGGFFHVPGAGFGVAADAGNGGIGVYATVNSGASKSYGVRGSVGSNSAADSAGVFGEISSNAANGAGVRGVNNYPSCCGMGVAGFHAGQGIGVYGEAQNGFAVSGFSPNNWSGYFQGSVNVVGTLYKSSGAFRIDNPIDPAHTYLQHSFVESPDMKNVYDGVVRTNGKGFATVTLPKWFGALNRDFRYQVTVVGRAHWDAKAAIWNEVKDNRFTIRTDQPEVKVSWQVTGIRNDTYANAHRIQVVVPKGSADGRYVHPELYGKPISKSVVVLPGMLKEARPTLR